MGILLASKAEMSGNFCERQKKKCVYLMLYPRICQGWTVMADYYDNVLRHLRANIWQKITWIVAQRQLATGSFKTRWKQVNLSCCNNKSSFPEAPTHWIWLGTFLVLKKLSQSWLKVILKTWRRSGTNYRWRLMHSQSRTSMFKVCRSAGGQRIAT